MTNLENNENINSSYERWEMVFKQYRELLNPPPSNRLLKNLWKREEGFDIIFKNLLSIKDGDFNIIETGSTRNPGHWTDGQSSFLFAKFVDLFGGNLLSIDIDPTTCEISKNYITSKNYNVICEDSLTQLKKHNLDNINLFYLDSFDVSFRDDTESADQHLKEFLVIEPHINKNMIIAIDDNIFDKHGRRAGKGRKIYEYLAEKNIYPIYDNYQIIYKF